MFGCPTFNMQAVVEDLQERLRRETALNAGMVSKAGYDQLRKENDDLIQENSDLEDTVEELRLHLSLEKEASHRLKSEVADLRKTYVTQNEFSRMREQMVFQEKRANRLEDLEKANLHLLRESDKLEAENKRLSETVNRLQDKLQRLPGSALREEIEELRWKLSLEREASQEENKKLKEQILDLEEEKSRIPGLREEICRLTRLVIQKNADVERLRQQLVEERW